jgi:hypothetical protein
MSATTKHTAKGLYIVDGRKMGGKTVLVMASTAGGSNFVVAEFHDKTGLRGGDLPALLNATLYAAAPELLNLLERVVETVDFERGTKGSEYEDEAEPLLIKVRAAIAKATGDA